MNVQDLPHLNATLNSISTILLISGWIAIRNKKVGVHIGFMVSALVASAAFLTSYLIYHYTVRHVPFQGQGFVRPIYFALLISHILLAIINLPMIIMTVIPAIGRKFDKHKRIARLTLPVWLYVSVTGVIVYWMCYIAYA